MKRLDRYIVREMVVPFLIGQGAVVFMLVGTVLYNNADTFLNYKIPALGVTKIAFYFLPYLINLTMPVAIALAASLTVSRLSRDTEVTAMRAAGISLKRIFLPIFVIGLLLSIGDFYFGERVVPWSNRNYERTMSELSRNIGFLVPQEKQAIVSPDRRLIAYIGRMELLRGGDQARLYDINILMHTQSPTNEDRLTVILADKADYNEGIWTLHDAKTHHYEKGGLEEIFVRSQSKPILINLRIPEKTFDLIPLQLPLYSSSSAVRSFHDLSVEIARQRKAGYVNPFDVLEYHFKLSVPFSCLVFAIACPPLALRFARAGNFMGVLLSIILVFVYWNTLLAAKILGARYPNIIPPPVAAWGQNVVFATIGFYFLWRGE